jgi:hypothetical protein
MAEWFEEIGTYLPKYLSADATNELFEELKQFPRNIDSRLYTSKLKDDPGLFQGDGLARIWISNLPDPRVETVRVMVISNTCDVTVENKKLLGPRLIYCPIISLPKYAQMVTASREIAADRHISDIRQQRIASMFYLPRIDALGEESVALLDRINNCDLQALNLGELVATRLFTLSDYGFYLFLFKLSIHLTRIRENVARN